MIELAKQFAAEKHAGQTYDKGQDYYTHHLIPVMETLQRFGCTDEELLVAALLHDVVEDTDVTVEEVEEMFGLRVATIVWCVTDAEGATRRDRHYATYPHIYGNEDATSVKLADRITNVETSLKWEDKYIKMYRREHLLFKGMIYKEGICEPMWAYLDELIEEGQ